MTDRSEDAPLIGVLATPHRVEAQIVARTGFGRLITAGRRIVEDVDGPTDFLPLDLDGQLGASGTGEAPLDDRELRAGQAWVETIANAIAKLTFGLQGGGIRVGLAVDAHLDAAGLGVRAARGGARVADLPGSLTAALRGRNIALEGPVGGAVALGHAWALGELHAPTGALDGVESALLLAWDQEVSWVEIEGGRVVGCAVEGPESPWDLGFHRLESMRVARCGAGERLLVAARRGDECVRELFEDAGRSLGARAGERIAPRLSSEDPVPARIVLGGQIGRFCLDRRFGPHLVRTFEGGLGAVLEQREQLAIDFDLLRSVEDAAQSARGVSDGFVHVSRVDAAAVIGAAARALDGPASDSGADAPLPRGHKSETSRGEER